MVTQAAPLCIFLQSFVGVIKNDGASRVRTWFFAENFKVFVEKCVFLAALPPKDESNLDCSGGSLENVLIIATFIWIAPPEILDFGQNPPP